jgi:inner membrane protein involved in colicin E2 resistance
MSNDDKFAALLAGAIVLVVALCGLMIVWGTS